jgi:hypothetical protein
LTHIPFICTKCVCLTLGGGQLWLSGGRLSVLWLCVLPATVRCFVGTQWVLRLRAPVPHIVCARPAAGCSVTHLGCGGLSLNPFLGLTHMYRLWYLPRRDSSPLELCRDLASRTPVTCARCVVPHGVLVVCCGMVWESCTAGYSKCWEPLSVSVGLQQEHADLCWPVT